MENQLYVLWQKSRLLFKVGFIGVLTLLLLIPMSFITGLVRDREQRHDQAYKEISGKWASAQTLTGPVLVVPYQVTSEEKSGGLVTETRLAYFLPDSLQVSGTLVPEKRYRGIYEVILYRSDLLVTGSFHGLEASVLKIPEKDWLPGQAFLLLGVTDMRGIENQLSVTWNGARKYFDPGMPGNSLLDRGVSVPVSLDTADLERGLFNFSMQLQLKGSGSLNVIPVGKSTGVHLSSSWSTPSFTGNFLPGSRQVSQQGFSADWSIFNLNRNLPQRWTNGNYKLDDASFGVTLMTPVDIYQKTTRCVKYAILIIALTFMVFFLVETSTGKQVHPFQYLLIGLALCVFYTLLISISEYLHFRWAYVIASVATTGLITLYTSWLFKDRKIPVLTGSCLILLYGFIFVLVQLQDFALLVGSIGLFLVLATLMYYSRRINRDDPASPGDGAEKGNA